jgi:general secretion pathway protein K
MRIILACKPGCLLRRTARRGVRNEDGIALIIVMIVIFLLTILAGRFAHSMKVETKLASNANNETELEWLGRSGVEYARWMLAEQMKCGMEPYDSLNQTWAGGPGGLCTTNSPLAEVQKEVHLGNGYFTWKITDLDRRININSATDVVLQQALTQMGADPGEFPGFVGSVLDWIDPDDSTHIEGTESEFYEGQEPPYEAKNGPIDDISEMLLIRGVSQDMFWGSFSTNHPASAFQERNNRFGRNAGPPTYSTGLAEIFTPISSGKVNVNTASLTVLTILLGGDEISAQNIIKLRAGPDGVDGTDDDLPLRNTGELVNAGINYQGVQQLYRYADVRSRAFQVEIEATIAGYHRTFVAILGRNSPRDIQILNFYWK